MCVRVIAELAMEVVSHADLRGAHAVPLPNVFAAVPDGTNALAPTAIENRTGGSSLARRVLQTSVKRETKLASNHVCSWHDADVLRCRLLVRLWGQRGPAPDIARRQRLTQTATSTATITFPRRGQV